jgi:predicted RNase H-like nuclease
VFPAPVRPVLEATSWEDACVRSRASAADVTKQTFAILPKIREVDALLQTRPELREVVREVHPEVCFSELAGASMTHHKASALGRKERQRALALSFPQLRMIEKGWPRPRTTARVACWSAIRLASGKGRSLPEAVPRDITGLPMAIWA